MRGISSYTAATLPNKEGLIYFSLISSFVVSSTALFDTRSNSQSVDRSRGGENRASLQMSIFKGVNFFG